MSTPNARLSAGTLLLIVATLLDYGWDVAAVAAIGVLLIVSSFAPENAQ